MRGITAPAPLAGIAVVGAVYLVGARRWQRLAGRVMVSPARRASFLAGLAVTAAAVASPLDRLSERSLTLHMVQHVLLLSGSGPLLALGAPVPALLWGLPESWRAGALGWIRALTRNHDRWQPGWVAAGLVADAVVMLGWHLPLLYEAALRHPGVHDAEHLSFVVVSTVSWWTVVSGRRSRRGAAAVAALVGSLSGIILGSALVIAPNPVYPSYAHLADQRLAGVVMWAFGGLLDDLVGAGLFASWLAMTRERAEESYVVPPLPGVVP